MLLHTTKQHYLGVSQASFSRQPAFIQRQIQKKPIKYLIKLWKLKNDSIRVEYQSYSKNNANH